MPSFQFSIDRLSFWLGFIAATLLWWLYSRLRPLFPRWRDDLRKFIDTVSARNLAGVEEYLRRETLRHAQHQHAAARLFSLDEVLIPPRLLVPPGGQDPSDKASPKVEALAEAKAVAATEPTSIAGQVLPYLPDWPELTVPLGAPTITPLQALQSERSLAIIGQPGSGRTVVLAHLASQIARRDPVTGDYQTAIPIFIHALELDPVLVADKDPLLNLIKAVCGTASVVMQPQVQRFLRSVFRDKQRKVVLFLDGLDEAAPAQMSALLDFLSALIQVHPRLQVVTSASAEYLGGLAKEHFYPLGLATWSQAQRTAFAKKWGELWAAQFMPELKHASPGGEIDPLLVQNWLVGENAYVSPLEWTLRLWGAYAGDLSGSRPVDVLETHLRRFLPNPAGLPALQELAHQMVQKPCASLSETEVEHILSQYSIQHPDHVPAGSPSVNQSLAFDDPSMDLLDPENAHSPNAEQTEPGKQSHKKNSAASQGEQMVSALIGGGILVRLANHQVRFTSPVFLGLLAGMKITPDEAAVMAQAMAKKLDWPIYPLVLQYAASCNENAGWIDTLIENPVAPLFRSLLLAARWLRVAPPNAGWRPHMMRVLVTLLQDPALPFGSRARVIAAFYLSRDPSTARLFKQLLLSKSPAIRRAALLGCGVLGSPQLINDILGLLADPDMQIRYTACLALAAIPGEAALNAIVEVLLSGDEAIRQAAAEALAFIQPDGHQVLQEAAGVDDLLTRRAAVFGLLQVDEPWAQKALEKIAIEDGQWIVRNAAAQALETLQQTASRIPRPLPRPSDSSWLITFASKLGMGLIPGQPATDVLLQVLKSGTVQEQVAALYYLRDQADEGIITALYDLLYSGQEELEEPVLHALWWIAATGVELPSPTQFGLG